MKWKTEVKKSRDGYFHVSPSPLSPMNFLRCSSTALYKVSLWIARSAIWFSESIIGFLSLSDVAHHWSEHDIHGHLCGQSETIQGICSHRYNLRLVSFGYIPCFWNLFIVFLVLIRLQRYSVFFWIPTFLLNIRFWSTVLTNLQLVSQSILPVRITAKGKVAMDDVK